MILVYLLSSNTSGLPDKAALFQVQEGTAKCMLYIPCQKKDTVINHPPIAAEYTLRNSNKQQASRL